MYIISIYELAFSFDTFHEIQLSFTYKQDSYYVSVAGLTASVMKRFFWDVTLHSLVRIDRRFGGTKIEGRRESCEMKKLAEFEVAVLVNCCLVARLILGSQDGGSIFSTWRHHVLITEAVSSQYGGKRFSRCRQYVLNKETLRF
jgi:hypothetical protein